MKKLYSFLIAMTVVSSVFAQDRNRDNYQQDNHNKGQQQWGYQQQYDNRANDKFTDKDHYYGQQPRMQEKDRRAAIDRINRDYDQQVFRYRNDRSINAFERDRRIGMIERERKQKLNAFGPIVLGAAIGALITGAIFSH
ncbi:MAG: hypothetical protein QM726_15895 [Chitinophagaceae bacterium]